MKTLYKWSIEDYHRLIETGILAHKQVELLEGEIVQMSPEGPLHASVNYSVVEYLRSLLGQRATVREAHPITLPNSEPEPDLAIVRSPYSNYIRTHPQPEDIYWLIEIAHTTLADDLGRKKTIYAKAKIPEYWVMDLQDKQLWIFRQPEGEDYLQTQQLTTGIVNSRVFPEVKVEVSQLLFF